MPNYTICSSRNMRGDGQGHAEPPHSNAHKQTSRRIYAYRFGVRSEDSLHITGLNWMQTPTHLGRDQAQRSIPHRSISCPVSGPCTIRSACWIKVEALRMVVPRTSDHEADH